MSPRTLLVAPLLALAGVFAHATDYKAGTLTIHRPHARATLPGQAVGVGYLTIVNDGPPDRLLAVEAGVSKKVELHTMAMEGDIMRMRELEAVDLPTGRAVEFKPGGYHLMFMGLTAPLKVGESFPVKLRFRKAGEVTVQVKVQMAGAEPGHPMKH